jgi:hypothetical protein
MNQTGPKHTSLILQGSSDRNEHEDARLFRVPFETDNLILNVVSLTLKILVPPGLLLQPSSISKWKFQARRKTDSSPLDRPGRTSAYVTHAIYNHFRLESH